MHARAQRDSPAVLHLEQHHAAIEGVGSRQVIVIVIAVAENQAAGLIGAAGYGLVGAVVTEILVGIPGMGQQLLQSLNDANATTTIALAIMLAVLGVVLTTVAAFIRSRALFWWEGGTS